MCGCAACRLPSYRYQRFPGNPNTDYENRLLFNVTLSISRGPWRCNLRTLIEGRFPDNRAASARLRFRPGLDYTLPLRKTWRPVIGVSNDFFLVPWNNPFANGGSSYTQNPFQLGARLPIGESLNRYLWSTRAASGISTPTQGRRRFYSVELAGMRSRPSGFARSWWLRKRNTTPKGTTSTRRRFSVMKGRKMGCIGKWRKANHRARLDH